MYDRNANGDGRTTEIPIVLIRMRDLPLRSRRDVGSKNLALPKKLSIFHSFMVDAYIHKVAEACCDFNEKRHFVRFVDCTRRRL